MNEEILECGVVYWVDQFFGSIARVHGHEDDARDESCPHGDGVEARVGAEHANAISLLELELVNICVGEATSVAEHLLARVGFAICGADEGGFVIRHIVRVAGDELE